MKHLKTYERWGLIAVLLLAWALRWGALMDVPPGWRDDDLIELYTFSQRILSDGPSWYFAGASGHEPLYHTVRAPLLAVAGLNQASARWLSAVCGTFAVLLTWAVGRRLFTREVGLLSGALVAVSFWALLYSRVAIRHMGALPWMLLAIYWGWRILQDKTPPRWASVGMALGVAGALLTYYAGRLIPALLGAALLVVGTKKDRVARYLLALGAGLLLAAPMFWTAAHIPGGDARVSEVAVPLTALRQGDLKPLLQTTWTTLGMAHAKGDPEWLYNVSERPVFGVLGALLFYLGVATRLGHLKQANARFVLLWLAAGMAPACLSLPPSSYGHAILALPAVYLLLAMPMKAAARRWSWTALPLFALTLGVVAARDVRDYFVTWPNHSMVRFLYRADYRALCRYLEALQDVQDAAVSSMLFGPWDKVAVQTDCPQAARLRWLDPTRALLDTGAPTRFFMQDESHPAGLIGALLAAAPGVTAPAGMQGFLVSLPELPKEARVTDIRGHSLAAQPFANALRLERVTVEAPSQPDSEGRLALWWEVVAPLPLPPEELIPYPPPPGVYSGLRLKVFTHLVTANGDFVAGDDGLWVDPYSLQVGDRFVQEHHLNLPVDAAAGPYHLRVGLYDPMTGERWAVGSGETLLEIALDSSQTAFRMTAK